MLLHKYLKTYKRTRSCKNVLVLAIHTAHRLKMCAFAYMTTTPQPLLPSAGDDVLWRTFLASDFAASSACKPDGSDADSFK